MLKPCPSSPNCVCSDATDPRHAIPPLALKPRRPDVWTEICAAVLSLPHTRIVEERKNYLHAECRSAVFRFVDDLELEAEPERLIVSIRSAARLGYYDFGVNRRRVENLRRLLEARNLLRLPKAVGDSGNGRG